MIGLRETKRPDHCAVGQCRKILLALFLGSIGVDGVHDQARLHRRRRTVGTVDPLDLEGDETVGNLADAGTAIAVDCRPQHPHLAHAANDFAIPGLLAKVLRHPLRQVVFAELSRRIADHAFVFVELLVQHEGVVPPEGGAGRNRVHGHCLSEVTDRQHPNPNSFA